MKKIENNKRGFIKMIILVVAGLVLIKYAYDIDVVGFLTKSYFKDWLDKIYNIASVGWQKYSDTLMKVFNYCIAFIKNILTSRGV